MLGINKPVVFLVHPGRNNDMWHWFVNKQYSHDIMPGKQRQISTKKLWLDNLFMWIIMKWH